MSLAPFPPTNPYGKSDWRDYVDNWRDADASWLQERVILRYEDASKRNTDLGASPGIGRVVYNLLTDRLELYNKSNAWQSINPLPINLKVVTDTTDAVALANVGAIPADRGITLGKDDVRITHVLRTQDSVLIADTTGLAIKTGGKTAKLTTDGTATVGNLISDTPISMPSLVLSGTGTVINTDKAVSVGALTAASGTVNGVLQVNGTLTATGLNNTIGGVGLTAGQVMTGANTTGGLVSGGGIHYGDVDRAIMRYRNPANGNNGAAQFQVFTDRAEMVSGPLYTKAGLSVYDTTISYYSSSVLRGYISPAFWGDPGVANVPEGSIYMT